MVPLDAVEASGTGPDDVAHRRGAAAALHGGGQGAAGVHLRCRPARSADRRAAALHRAHHHRPADPAAAARQIAEAGYSVELGEHIAEVHSIAVPIRDYTRNVVGSLAVSGPAYRMSGERIEKEIAPLMQKAGQRAVEPARLREPEGPAAVAAPCAGSTGLTRLAATRRPPDACLSDSRCVLGLAFPTLAEEDSRENPGSREAGPGPERHDQGASRRHRNRHRQRQVRRQSVLRDRHRGSAADQGEAGRRRGRAGQRRRQGRAGAAAHRAGDGRGPRDPGRERERGRAGGRGPGAEEADRDRAARPRADGQAGDRRRLERRRPDGRRDARLGAGDVRLGRQAGGRQEVGRGDPRGRRRPRGRRGPAAGGRHRRPAARTSRATRRCPGS